MIRVSKKKTTFHIVSQLRNDRNQYVAMIYHDKKLKIGTYDPEDDDHEISVSLYFGDNIGKQAVIAFVFPFLLMGGVEAMFGQQFEEGNAPWFIVVLLVLNFSCIILPCCILSGESRKNEKKFPYKKNELECDV